MEMPTGGLAALAQEAAYSYNVYAPDRVRPVEIRASDSAQLVQWASNRLHQPVKVPDLAASGYRLMGGRVVATSHGPAAMFMYDDDHGERLVVLTRPMTTDQGAPMTPQTGGDVAGFSLGRQRHGLQPRRPVADGSLAADRQRGPPASADDLKSPGPRHPALEIRLCFLP